MTAREVTDAPVARPARATVPAERLARLGFGAGAQRWVAALGLTDVDQREEVLAVLGAGPDPGRALAAAARLAERSPSGWAALVERIPRPHAPRAAGGHLAGDVPGAPRDPLTRLGLVAGASDALADLLLTDPGLLAVLTGDLVPHDAATAAAFARAAVSGAQDQARTLARAQRRGIGRIALRDLLGLADTPAIARELADLADGVLAVALEVATVALPAGTRLTVLSMGKLGAGELNYVSDVDVLFVADGDLGAATAAAEAFLRLCGAATPEGRAYEVDPTLRPEGRDGALVRSLDGYRTYYERWAAAWESQALLKARTTAGDRELGAAFEALAVSVVWPDRRAAADIADIQRLKGRAEASPKVRRAGEREVKLGPGGLRDIEFSVQLLQLVHGRHDAALRQRATLPALHALAEGGYIGEEDARLFADAYRFLRTVEHRLQLRGLRRTHALPAEGEARRRLARALGYPDTAQAPAVERFDADLRRVRGDVRRVHEKLFYRPLLARFAGLGAAEQVADDQGRFDAAAVRDRLVALGFTDPEAALRALEALTAGTGRRARLLRTLLPTMLPALAATPDPDSGLAALRSLAERLDTSPAFLGALRDAPPGAELLATVLGRSPLVGRWLERQPEVLPFLGDVDGLARPREAEEYRRLAEGPLRRHPDEADLGAALRRLARRELARVALRDLSGAAAAGEVARELTALSEACLEAAVAGTGLAVIGLGKLGGRELSYGSDLDVLVVFDAPEDRGAALAATERLVRLISGPTAEGRAFEVDLGLRPEGADGPLARTLDSYRLYYERWAEPWELQALTQARPVAGNRALGRAFVEVLTGLVYPPRVPAGHLAAILMMKARIENERPRPGRTGRLRRSRGVDVKLDAGGLTDVEWTVQLLQLAHGGLLPQLRRRGTLPALTACADEGLLSDDEAGALRTGYLLLTRLRQALYLSGARDTATLPAVGDLSAVAGLLALDEHWRAAAGDHLEGDHVRALVAARMRAVRDVHLRVTQRPT